MCGAFLQCELDLIDVYLQAMPSESHSTSRGSGCVALASVILKILALSTKWQKRGVLLALARASPTKQ